jgi:hypothetical protein
MSEVPAEHLNAHNYEYQALDSPSHSRLIELLPTHAQSDRYIHYCCFHQCLKPCDTHLSLSSLTSVDINEDTVYAPESL